MVISQPPGNNPSYYVRFTNAASIALNVSETPCVLYMQLQNIRVTLIEMVLLSIFFTRIRSTEGLSADCSYSFCRSMRLLFHLAVKYYFKSFYEDFEHRWFYIHLSVVFPPECQQTALCYATNTIK